MYQEENFIKQWFNLGYPDDLSRFHNTLALGNLQILMDAGILLAPFLMIFSMVLAFRMPLRDALPFAVVGGVLAVFSIILWNVVKKLREETDAVPSSAWCMLLFSSVLFALAFYYELCVKPDGRNLMLCFVFIGVGVLFHVFPLKNLIFLGTVLIVFLTVSSFVREKAFFTMEDWNVLAAALLGFFLGWQKTRGTIATLLALEREKTDRIREKEAKSIIGQLQPHFMYNTLASIQYLCRVDQRLARTAIDQFCRVMRGNMNAVTRRRKIPFSEELEHTKSYVELEQLRFGDCLMIHYDIQEDDFMIPALTLQSVVENTIKHGICTQKHGGIVLVHCQARRKWIEITVTENGALQDTDNFRWQDRWEDSLNHVGLKTIQQRMQAVMEGEIVLEYLEGIGSIVTIRILKEEVEKVC